MCLDGGPQMADKNAKTKSITCPDNACLQENSGAWFRSTEIWVMSPNTLTTAPLRSLALAGAPRAGWAWAADVGSRPCHPSCCCCRSISDNLSPTSQSFIFIVRVAAAQSHLLPDMEIVPAARKTRASTARPDPRVRPLPHPMSGVAQWLEPKVCGSKPRPAIFLQASSRHQLATWRLPHRLITAPSASPPPCHHRSHSSVG